MDNKFVKKSEFKFKCCGGGRKCAQTESGDLGVFISKELRAQSRKLMSRKDKIKSS